MAVPIDDVLKDFPPLKENSAMIFVLFILVILILTAVGILLVRVAQKNAYLEGLKDGRKKKT